MAYGDFSRQRDTSSFVREREKNRATTARYSSGTHVFSTMVDIPSGPDNFLTSREMSALRTSFCVSWTINVNTLCYFLTINILTYFVKPVSWCHPFWLEVMSPLIQGWAKLFLFLALFYPWLNRFDYSYTTFYAFWATVVCSLRITFLNQIIVCFLVVIHHAVEAASKLDRLEY